MNREHLSTIAELVGKLHAGRVARDAACDASQSELSNRIKREIDRGHAPDQAKAIAYSELGEPK